MEKQKLIKKSYQDSEPSIILPNSLEEKDTATDTGGRGFNLNEMSNDYDQTHGPEKKSDPALSSSESNFEHKEIFDILYNLGEQLDIAGEVQLANFSDFLLKKFAEVDNPELNFNKLMIKINNADITNTGEIIKKLTKIYSRTVMLEYYLNSDINESKKSAYKKMLHRANQYLYEG